MAKTPVQTANSPFPTLWLRDHSVSGRRAVLQRGFSRHETAPWLFNQIIPGRYGLNLNSPRMRLQLIVRRLAGAFVLGSLLLAHFHSSYWLWFTAFVGFNLL